MAEYHHHHRKHRRDGATIFKEKSLRAIELRKKIEKGIRLALYILATLMGLAVFYVYTFG